MLPFTEHIGCIRLLFDFGLVVLIWMVQLIIYPSFMYFRKTDLLSWHDIYTKRISIVVIPLMFGQLFLGIFQLVQALNFYTLVSMVLITAVWVSTFAQFVPMHHAISKGNTDGLVLKRLVQRNRLRTFIWSAIFILNAMALFS